MNLIIIHPNSDSGLCIVHPLPHARLQILVSDALTEPTFMREAELDEAGEVVTPAIPGPPRVVTPAVYRHETDAEFALRIARKDVPQGLPFRIIPRTDLPEDRADRDLWDADFSNPDGHGGDQ